ncbi:MAG: amino acid ABC transporter permease [Desulfobacteraceae bacterium]|jgi:polar amino acid transport system permease protein|nr:amino acid ABC transporter permease [Desulfobacteraceae bacterium]
MLDLLLQNSHLIWRGLSVTLETSAWVIVAASIGGLFTGIMLLYGPLPLRLLIRAYVDTVRGIPLLVLIFSVFYGLPAMGMQISAFVAAVLALSIFGTAHVSEVVRGAVDSIPDGQTEAAKAIGLTFYKRLRYVIFPQALARAIPPWTNTAVELVKASSLLALVSIIDLLYSTEQIAARTREPLLFYGVAAILYFSVNYSLSLVGARVEKKFRYSS